MKHHSYGWMTVTFFFLTYRKEGLVLTSEEDDRMKTWEADRGRRQTERQRSKHTNTMETLINAKNRWVRRQTKQRGHSHKRCSDIWVNYGGKFCWRQPLSGDLGFTLMHHPCVLVYKMHNKASHGIFSHLSLNTDTKSGQAQHILFFLLCPWPTWTLWLTALWDLFGLVPASGKSMFPVTLLALSGWGLDLCAVINCSVFLIFTLNLLVGKVFIGDEHMHASSALRRLTLLPVALLPRLLQFSCSSISSLWEATPEGQWWTRTSWPPTGWKPFLWWLHTWEIRIFKYQHKQYIDVTRQCRC